MVDSSSTSTCRRRTHGSRPNYSARRAMTGGLTNAFSKNVENHAAAIALYFMFYNFGRASDAPRHTSHGSRRFRSCLEHRRSCGVAMKVALVALATSTLTIVSLSSAQTSVGTSCKPVFERVEYYRGVPWTFVDQGLESLPHLYPRHQLLAHRRASQLGEITFSLLVYKKDAIKPEVTIEGMALTGPPQDLKAWRFTTRCQTEGMTDGLVTTLEEIAKLSRSPVKIPN